MPGGSTAPEDSGLVEGRMALLALLSIIQAMDYAIGKSVDKQLVTKLEAQMSLIIKILVSTVLTLMELV